MARLIKGVWKDNGWQRGDQIPGGNQGHAFFARKVTDPPETFDYVLKTLKRQDDADRRAMFCAEILAMKALDHPGVIRVEDTNAECFRENVELYLVTPRVPGPDLEEAAKEHQLSLEEAVRVTMAVLGILDHCHKRGVLHRDIKPCHVVLQGRSFDNPVLIDFGLAYHRDTQPNDAATRPGQGKGNRFLIGPEHLTPNPDTNRDPATDICQCLGLLFYAITGKPPGVLQDEQHRKPQERMSLETLRPDIDEWKRNALLQVLDVGFEWEPAHRWQNAERLIARLNTLLGREMPKDEAFRLGLADLVRRAKTDSDTARYQRACNMVDGLVDTVRTVIGTLSAETSEYLTVKAGNAGGHGNMLACMCIGFDQRIDRTRSRAVSFVVEWSGDTRIDVSLKPYTGNLSFFPDCKPVHLGNYEVGSAECQDEVLERLMPYLHMCVAEVIGVDPRS